MKYIKNFSLKDKKISFTLLNNSQDVKISLANAIRRIVMSNIPVYTTDEHKTVFFENNSILDNEFLNHRLQLVPINSEIDDLNYDELVITCKKSNEDEIISSVYVKDFICKVGEKIIDNNLLFPYPDILFSKLKMNQKLAFEAHLNKNNEDLGGAFYSPVCTCVYTFEIDEKEVSEITKSMTEKQVISFKTQEIERTYKKNEVGDPHSYLFEIESIGFYSPKNLLNMGMDILKNKLTTIKNEILNEKSEKVFISRNKDNSDFIVFDIQDENDTIGNLLSSYLTYDKDVFYAGYIIEHPLKRNFLLKMKLKDDNTFENIIKKLTETIDKLLKIVSSIHKEI